MSAQYSTIFGMEIYAEYYFIENFIANMFLLMITAKIWRLRPRRWRTLLGSFVATLYAFGLFLPAIYFIYHPLMKLCFVAIFVLMVFGRQSRKDMIKLMVTFYISGILMGGLVAALMYLMGNNFIIANNAFYLGNITYLKIISFCMAAYFMIKVMISVFSERGAKERVHVSVFISLDGKEVHLNGLIDTGNFLKDPISGKSVFIAEYGSVKSILPKEIDHLINGLQCEENTYCSRVRMIPYKTLGTDGGMIIGVRPDKVMVKKGEAEMMLTEGIMGIYKGEFSGDKDYNVILHPEMLKREAEIHA